MKNKITCTDYANELAKDAKLFAVYWVIKHSKCPSYPADLTRREWGDEFEEWRKERSVQVVGMCPKCGGSGCHACKPEDIFT